MTLFPSPGSSGKKTSKHSGLTLTLHFDGGSRGNPGPAGIGVVLLDEDKTPLYELGEFLGIRTSNFSEYTALIRGLTAAKTFQPIAVKVLSDSELVVRQINGQYKVKSPDLLPLYQTARRLIDELGNVTVSHVYREKNARADELANLAMDRKSKVEPLGAPWTPGTPKPAPVKTLLVPADEPTPTRFRDLSRIIEISRAARQLDPKLTVEELEALLLIALKPGQSPGDIGDHLKRSPAAVSRLIETNLMTQHELIYQDNRDADSPEDRLYLTEKGERFIQQLLRSTEK